MKALVTGGTGTIGHALVPLLLARGYEVIVFSRDELKQSQMRKEFPTVCYILGDVRDYDRLREVLPGVQRVIHAAALKRVDNTTDPLEVIKTNVMGSSNVARACRETGVPEALFTSSDKAAYPINLYGMTKALAEKVFLHYGYTVVRYGNVLGSRGSLLQEIEECRREGRPIPVTDRRMTRFWWTPEEAASWILSVPPVGRLFVPVMKSRPVLDLITEAAHGHPTIDVGLRPGWEKLHEWLMTIEESRCAVLDEEKGWYEVVPGFPVGTPFEYVSGKG